jgi:hypothetical protein
VRQRSAPVAGSSPIDGWKARRIRRRCSGWPRTSPRAGCLATSSSRGMTPAPCRSGQSSAAAHRAPGHERAARLRQQHPARQPISVSCSGAPELGRLTRPSRLSEGTGGRAAHPSWPGTARRQPWRRGRAGASGPAGGAVRGFRAGPTRIQLDDPALAQGTLRGDVRDFAHAP